MKKRVISQMFLVVSIGVGFHHEVIYADELSSDMHVKVTAGLGEGETEELISTKPARHGEFIIKAASDFTFITIPIGETRSATIDRGMASGIEIVDVTGSGSGWTVQVSMGALVISEGLYKGESLKGWSLKIPSVEVTSKSASLDPEKIPTGKTVTLSESLSGTVFSAKESQGMGRYTNIFDRYQEEQEATRKTGVQLAIPNSARKATYLGKLKWTLINAPGI